MGLIGSLITGFVAGSLASWIMPGGNRHWIVDIILGLLGGLLGGWIFDKLLGVATGGSWWMNLIVATIGACILIFIGRLFKKKQ